MEYQRRLLFVYDDEGVNYQKLIEENPYVAEVALAHVDDVLSMPESFLEENLHIVIAAHTKALYGIFSLAITYKTSIAILPLPHQKTTFRAFRISGKIDEQIELACRDNAKAIDVLQCNDRIAGLQTSIGMVPLLDIAREKQNLWTVLKQIGEGMRQFFRVRLQQFEIETENGKKINTAASGAIVLWQGHGSFLTRLVKSEHSMRDGQLLMVLISPFSVINYIKLLFSIITFSGESKVLPKVIGIVKSSSITLKTGYTKSLKLADDTELELPVKFSVLPEALRLNASERFWEENPKTAPDKEKIKVDNLPDEREIKKYLTARIPLFSYASEERFKELFLSLREEAKINMHYVMLMILSTLLASIGLFANSSAVVIGAMLLAPLMAPIVSLAMGMLRADENILKNSILKITVGIALALGASAGLALLLPELALTDEMRARINPNLLDMGVAIFSGMAAAYSKSFKEIAQSLAGVAIAVALVPPLSVAGIGLGQGNMDVFLGAFLLFFTNLVGISIAATFTFQILGFSNVVKSKKSMLIVSTLLIAIIFPLFFSYNQIIKNYRMEKFIQHSRFLVNDKYVIIKTASVTDRRDVIVLDLTLSVREALGRQDFELLKRKLQDRVEQKLFIRAKVEYIL